MWQIAPSIVHTVTKFLTSVCITFYRYSNVPLSSRLFLLVPLRLTLVRVTAVYRYSFPCSFIKYFRYIDVLGYVTLVQVSPGKF